MEYDFFEELIVNYMVKNFAIFYRLQRLITLHEYSLLFSQNPATGRNPDPVESISHPWDKFRRYPAIYVLVWPVVSFSFSDQVFVWIYY